LVTTHPGTGRSPPMPPRIIAVLARLRQDLAACLSPEAIRQACRDEGHRWRERQLGPVATVSLFLLQVLHGNTACQNVVHFARWAASAGAYCQARKRLPLGVLHRLLERVAASVRGATAEAARWLGHRVWVVDGSSFSMPDTPALRAAFGQPAGQRPGLRLPRRQVDGAVRRRHRHAPPLGDGAAALGRDGPLRRPLRRPGAGRRRPRGPRLLLVCPPRPARRPRPARGVPHPPAADRRLHARPPQGGPPMALGEPGAAPAFALGAGARPGRPGRRLVQAQGPPGVDGGGGLRGPPRRGRGPRAALPGRGARLPGRRGHAGDDAPGGGGLPGGGAGPTSTSAAGRWR